MKQHYLTPQKLEEIMSLLPDQKKVDVKIFGDINCNALLRDVPELEKLKLTQTESGTYTTINPKIEDIVKIYKESCDNQEKILTDEFFHKNRIEITRILYHLSQNCSVLITPEYVQVNYEKLEPPEIATIKKSLRETNIPIQITINNPIPITNID